VGGCVVISDKAQRTRKWALSWAQYRRRDNDLRSSLSAAQDTGVCAYQGHRSPTSTDLPMRSSRFWLYHGFVAVGDGSSGKTLTNS